MAGKLINVGFGNMVVAKKILAIVSPKSAPMKRLRSEARDSGQMVDVTQGRRERSIIITDSGHVILSAVQAETLAMRFEQANFEEQHISLREDEEE
jgi:regulator of extracellular matrix RemA (YlzA/DUF370 family)